MAQPQVLSNAVDVLLPNLLHFGERILRQNLQAVQIEARKVARSVPLFSRERPHRFDGVGQLGQPEVKRWQGIVRGEQFAHGFDRRGIEVEVDSCLYLLEGRGGVEKRTSWRVE